MDNSFFYINATISENEYNSEESIDNDYFNSEETLDNDYFNSEENDESNDSEENDETKESDDSEENIILCKNNIICKNNIFTFDNNYCKECFLYFNKKIIFKKQNITLQTCPLCLSNEKSNIIISLYKCEHIICYNCIYNIFWNINENNENFPYKQLYELWKLYLNSNLSRKLKCFVIYKLVNDDINIFDENYNIYIKNIKLKTIPKIFINKLKELIFYHVTIEKNRINDNKNRYNMRNSIKNCPYCREELN